MAIFGRKIPFKVMVGAEAPKVDAAIPTVPPRKETIMDTKPNNKATLLQDSAPVRRFTPEDAPVTSSGVSRQPVGAGETVISGETTIEGKIIAQAELRIDGTFKGEIVSDSRVIVGTAGKVEGTVQAKTMVVSGRVVGNLKVHERLELQSTGELFGDLETQPGALIIEKGARLEGRCTMGIKKDNKSVLPSPQPPKTDAS